MSAHHTHQDITKRLKTLSDQLSNGDLSEEELNEFETLSRRLYERAIVLNYKAKEAHVYSTTVSEELVEEEVSETKEVAEETEDQDPIEKEEPQAEETTAEESGEIAFDFSSDAEVENTGSDSQKEQGEIIQKDDAEEERESVVASEEEKEATSKSSEPQKEEVNSFFERFTKVHDDSLMSKLGASKLDTLKGAIGLNDKMQFISELFDGSSDLFNEAIEKLDTQQNNENARLYLSEIAVKQSWDAENPLVEEFVRILDRRYAE